MCAVMNGLALHGGLIPYGGTFLVFSDYARNALRMAALMGLRAIYVFTHDSIGLGEDGPTHQPIEHAASLRLIPNMDVWRPCDTVETAVAWSAALERKNGPTALLLTRQNVPFQKRAIAWTGHRAGAAMCCPMRPAPVRSSSPPAPKCGSPLEAQKQLAAAGIAGAGGFHAVDQRFRPAGRPNTGTRSCRRHCPASRSRRASAITGASTSGLEGAVVGIDRYGESAPAPAICSSTSASRPETSVKVSKEHSSHDDQGRHQRLRPHRPQHPARPLRGRQEARASVRRGQRPRRREDQRAPPQVRHRARQLSAATVAGRRRQHRGQRRPHQGRRRARSGQAAVEAARRRRGAGMHGPVHQQGEGRRAPAGRREEGDHLGARREGRRPHRGLRREPQGAEGRATR